MTSPSTADSLAKLIVGRRERTERELAVDPLVGKDILQLLSSSMYVDPRAIYREYVQNSADAIDEACERGQLPGDSDGRIDISIDVAARNVVIRDNGVGVPASHAEQVLTSFGASPKRGTGSRGFRGVGRLAAFGYAQAVTFRSKSAGDIAAVEIRWDCRKLKLALSDPSYSGDLRRVVRDVVTVASEKDGRKGDHYFEVRLERVIRIKNDLLLNLEAIKQYLSEVSPAPFRSDFRQRDRVLSELAAHVPPCRFRIYVNDAQRHVCRPYQTEFPVTEKKTDRIRDVEVVTLSDGEGQPQAVVWMAHHSYVGALHASPMMRGLRARVGDMQIGDDQVFASYFPEPRFNAWTIGEVHVLDRRIVPNGRRDGFEQNEYFADLITKLVPYVRTIGAKCRATSAARARIRRFDRNAARLRQLFALLSERQLSTRRESAARKEVACALDDMTRAAEYVGLLEEDQQLLKRKLSTLNAKYRALKTGAKPRERFRQVPKARRAAYEEVIDLVAELLPIGKHATALIDRIVGRLEQRTVRRKERARSA